MKSSDEKKGKKGKVEFGSIAVEKPKGRAFSGKLVHNSNTFLDSGASTSMFCSKLEALKNSYCVGSESVVQVATGKDSAKCLGTGTIDINGILIEGMHIEDLNDTLISVGQVCDKKNIVIFTSTEAVILRCTKFTADRKDIVAIIPRDPNTKLYTVAESGFHEELNDCLQQGKAIKSMSKSISLWHNRLVHVGHSTLRNLHLHVDGFPKLQGNTKPCHPCKLGKATKKSFKSNFKPVQFPGEVVHPDLVGPLPVSLDGAVYVCTFIDRYSRYTHAVGIAKKSDVPEMFEDFKTHEHVKKYFKNGVVRLHTDGGGEYEKVDIELHSETTPHTPQHNPFSERFNRTFLEPIRTMLGQAGLSGKYWEYALGQVVYVKNRVFHRSIGCSAFEKLTGTKPTLKHIRVFGCAAFVYEHDPVSKIHATAAPAIMLGCNDNSVYTLERLNDKKIINSVHVTFDEQSFPKLDLSDSSSSGEENDEYTDYDSESDSSSDVFEQWDNSSLTDCKNSETPKTESTNNSNLRRSIRERHPPDRYSYSGRHRACNSISFPITTSDQPTVRDATNATRDEAELWRKVIITELSTLSQKGA